MAAELMGDPQRLKMWDLLRQTASEGIASIQRWTPADGLPHGTPTPAHQHTMPTLVLGLAGTTRVQGRTTLDLGPGDVLVIDPGCWHDHVPHRPGTISFGLGFLAGRCDVLFFDDHQVLWGAVPDQPYRELVDHLLVATIADRLTCIDRILGSVIADRINFVDWIQPGVLAMAAYLWNHLHEPIQADTVVEHSGLGRTQSFALFKQFFGRTPKQELQAQRLELGRWLLRSGFTVTETAARCGYPNRADFTRAFRRAFGHPPSQVAPDVQVT